MVAAPLPARLSMTARELSRYGVLSVAASISPAEVELLIRDLPAVGCRGPRGDPTYCPQQAREVAREVVASWCTVHAEARQLTAITRTDDGHLTTCARCHLVTATVGPAIGPE